MQQLPKLPTWQIYPQGHTSALWADGRVLLWTHGEQGIIERKAPTLADAREASASAETLWIAPREDEWLQVQSAVKRGEAKEVGRDEITGAIFPKEKKGELVAQLADHWHKAEIAPGGDRGRVIARGLYLAAELLGVRLRYSPSYSGRTLMLDTLKHSHFAQRGGALDMTQDWKDRIARLVAKNTGDLTPQMHYARPLREAEQQGAGEITLYSYDRNMSFVCSALEVPTGEPEETHEYLPGQLGAYRVNASAPATWAEELPGYIGVRTGEAYGAWPREVCGAWAWSHQIGAAMRQGWQVEILEGFAWTREQKHAILKPWSEGIWSARLRAREARARYGASAEIAEGIIKACGVSAIGRLKQAKSHAIIRPEQAEAKDARIITLVPDDMGEWSGLVEAFFDRSPDMLYQPAWWASIVSLATERLVNGCMIAGARTLAAYVDGVMTLAPVPELAGEATKRGGWRYVGEARYDRADLTGAPSAIIRNLTRGREQDA